MSEQPKHVVLFTQISMTLVIAAAILYLANEVRTNTRAVVAATTHGVTEAFREQYPQVARNGELAGILLNAGRDPESVPTTDRFRFYAHLFSMFHAFEAAYYQMEAGGLDSERWQGFEQQMIDLTDLPGVKGFWELRKHWFSKDFGAYVDHKVVGVTAAEQYQLPGS